MKGLDMTQRGRKSAAALAVQPPDGVLETITRPDAPYDLTDEEAGVWRGVIEQMPANWFGAPTFPLLTQYCRHVVRSRRIASLINAAEMTDVTKTETVEFDIQAYDQLLKMQERESRAIATLATKMRLAQQSTIAPDLKKKGAIGLKRPWES
jgi:hypothetical protein